jgi:hypothetical protein
MSLELCITTAAVMRTAVSAVVPGSGEPVSAFCCTVVAMLTISPVAAAVVGLNWAPGEDASPPKIFHYILTYKYTLSLK